jgi:hypothetical protein
VPPVSTVVAGHPKVLEGPSGLTIFKTPPYFFCDAVVVWVVAVVVWDGAVVDVTVVFVVAAVVVVDVVVDFGVQASSKSKHTSIKARTVKQASGNNFNFIIGPH